MTARFVYWMNTSLDLRIQQHPGEQGGGSWLRITELLHREFNARARDLALMVQGRIIFETMEQFWPAARDNATLPGFLREYGQIWTAAPKIMVSRTRTEAEHNTTVLGGNDAINQLGRIREKSFGYVGVGGANLASQLLAAGFLDELWLFTHPVLLGTGRPLFDSVDQPIHLELLEQQSYGHGVTLHRYAVDTTADK